jgi:hypothetical protein
MNVILKCNGVDMEWFYIAIWYDIAKGQLNICAPYVAVKYRFPRRKADAL